MMKPGFEIGLHPLLVILLTQPRVTQPPCLLSPSLRLAVLTPSSLGHSLPPHQTGPTRSLHLGPLQTPPWPPATAHPTPPLRGALPPSVPWLPLYPQLRVPAPPWLTGYSGFSSSFVFSRSLSWLPSVSPLCSSGSIWF